MATETLEADPNRPAGRVLAQVASIARSVLGTAAGLATGSLLSGATVWIIWTLRWGWPDGWGVLLAIGMLAVLLTPGAVLVLFWLGLRAVAGWPRQLARSAAAASYEGLQWIATVQAPPDGSGRLRRLVAAARSAMTLRTMASEGRDLLIRGAVLLRVFHPISLVVVLVSFGVSCAYALIGLVALIVAIG